MVIETYGFTKDPRLNGLDSYILVMEYASGGNLHEYLQKNFTRIGWQEKLDILFNIINGYLYFKYISK
jgi:serine/threonine protein kinase